MYVWPFRTLPDPIWDEMVAMERRIAAQAVEECEEAHESVLEDLSDETATSRRAQSRQY